MNFNDEAKRIIDRNVAIAKRALEAFEEADIDDLHPPLTPAEEERAERAMGPALRDESGELAQRLALSILLERNKEWPK